MRFSEYRFELFIIQCEFWFHGIKFISWTWNKTSWFVKIYWILRIFVSFIAHWGDINLIAGILQSKNPCFSLKFVFYFILFFWKFITGGKCTDSFQINFIQSFLSTSYMSKLVASSLLLLWKIKWFFSS